MTVSAKKSRKKTFTPVQVVHRVYGPGEVMEAKVTDSGQVLIVRFPDGATRSLLAASEFWVTLPDLTAIPTAKTPAPEPEADAPEIDEKEPVIDDVELIA